MLVQLNSRMHLLNFVLKPDNTMLQVYRHTEKVLRNHPLPKYFPHQFWREIICKTIIAVTLIAYTSVCTAQKNEGNFGPVLRGQVLNIEDATPVAKAVITNHRTKASVSADILGRFTINALRTDSLEISSLGFQRETVSIPAIYSVSDNLIIYARPHSFLLPEININMKKEQIKIGNEYRIASPYFRNDIMKEKPISEKVYDNQISFVKIPFRASKNANHEIRQAKESDSQWNSISRFYNKAVVCELTGLNNTEADNLMMYINSKRLFERMTTKENATFTIVEQFKMYKAERH